MKLSHCLLAISANLTPYLCRVRNQICAVRYAVIKAVSQLRVKSSSILHSSIAWATPLLLVALFTPSLIHAQSTSASLTGLIDDPARAVIVGAQVTAINTETGVKTSTTSNREGQYVLPNLQPGSYRLEVDHPGFKGIIEAGLTLHVQDGKSSGQ